MRPTRTQAIKTFLEASTHKDLASLYNASMEVQVNVAQDDGTRIDGDFKGRQWHGYSNACQTWKPIRIPYNANSNPEYIDIEISYDLAEHAEGIGLTGWCWAKKESHWVAFDFDAISGHSEKHTKKMTEEELNKLKEAVSGIEWVTLRKSTSGKGLHVYVFVTPTQTSNHTEHAALARAILSKMSAIAGFDFSAKADCVGGNMWVWHRKMRGTDGLSLLKPGIILTDIPANWKDHVKVITGRRSMNLPKFIEDQESSTPDIEDKFTELCCQNIRCPLDDEHKRLLEWLDHRYPSSSWWDSDHWMLVTHTTLLTEAHEELGLRGLFATSAQGRDKGSDWNAYAFPIRKGGWSVRRYTPGCAEHPLWKQDGQGWTTCLYNRLPDLTSVCRMFEAIEDPAGGYLFSSVELAMKAALHLGVDIDVPTWALNRKCTLKRHKSGRLLAILKHDSDDPPILGWLGEKSKWQKLFEMKTSEPNEPEVIIYDEEVRHLITESGEDYGWVVYSDCIWHSEPHQNVKDYLASRGHGPKEVAAILGNSIARHWTMINLPFQPEYPKDRRWNRGAAQFRFRPTINRDNLKYPTWLKIFNHLGAALNSAVSQDAWAKANGVLTGADYLKCWVASLFKFPCEPLPYLFFYGPQNSGKSIFHEALQLLVTPSNVVVRADTALTSQSNFNGELETCILAVIEETDLQRNKVAYNRIKDWVTSVYLPIHKKQKQPYTVRNTTHFCQMSNSILSCPVFSGDTRIVMCYVNELEPEELIPKRDLLKLLELEAPDFMTEILNLELPSSNDRLNIPIIRTEDKVTAEEANRTFLEIFLQEKTFHVDGTRIAFTELYERFAEWLDPQYVKEWSKIRFGREMPQKYPKGRLPQTGQFWFGNIAWDPRKPESEILPKFTVKDGFLVEET